MFRSCSCPLLTYGEEEQAPFQEVSDVVENGPGLHVDPIGGYLGVVDSMEEEGERLEEHQGSHDPVDPVDLGHNYKLPCEEVVSCLAPPAQNHSS